LERDRTVSLDLVPPRERLALLGANLALAVEPADRRHHLRLAAQPCYRLRRPMAWESLADVVEIISALLD
jgi:hypothetical protein